jgi:hypothetical protein
MAERESPAGGWREGGVMLTRVRIEVEEETAEKCVEALMKYEHALHQQETRRYRLLWPISAGGEHVNTPEEEYPTPDHPWSDDAVPRSFCNSQLGREITEEVIEYDQSLPGYRGRRVVVFTRIDTRRASVVERLWEIHGPVDVFNGTISSGSGRTNP